MTDISKEEWKPIISLEKALKILDMGDILEQILAEQKNKR